MDLGAELRARAQRVVSETICLRCQAHTPRMTRLTQPAFGKRTQKPRPPSAPGATEDPWRIDWRILALVTVVFVVAFVWLF